MQNVLIDVSIPERVLGWLKQVFLSPGVISYFVSIPERVLGWLKPARISEMARTPLVSIPERVLGWLKRRGLEIQSICSFQGSVVRIVRIVAFLSVGLANHHLHFILAKQCESTFEDLRGRSF